MGSFTRWGFWATTLEITDAFAMQLLEPPCAGAPCENEADPSVSAACKWPVCTFLRVITLENYLSKFSFWKKTSYHPPTYCYSSPVPAFLLLFGVSAWFFPPVLPGAERSRTPMPLRKLPPSVQPRGRLENPHKVLKDLLLCNKKITVKADKLFLGTCDAHHIPPLAASRAPACHGGLFYTKPKGFSPLWCPVGNGPSALIHIRSIQPLKHLPWFTLKCHQNICN